MLFILFIYSLFIFYRLQKQQEFSYYSPVYNNTLNNLPSSLLFLDLSLTEFDHPVDQFPSSLQHLLLSPVFNHSISSLPKSLEYLKVGLAFNQSVDYLPPSLSHLILTSFVFDKQVNLLPPKLTHLEFMDFSSFFNHRIDNLPLSSFSQIR